MATLKALIREKKANSKGECTIYVRYGHRQKTTDFSSGIKVKASEWNEKRQTINSISDLRPSKINEQLIKDRKRIDMLSNNSIEELKAKISKAVREIKHDNKDPDIDSVKENFIQSLKPEESTNSELLLDRFKKFIHVSNKSDSTKKAYGVTVHHLKSYEEKRKIKLKISDLTLKKHDDMVQFLLREIKQPNKTVGLSDNTVATFTKRIKVFLSYLKERNESIAVEPIELKTKYVQTPIYFLTEEEVVRLTEHRFKNDRLNNVRDVFVFNCYTGLRYSDLSRLSKHHIKDNVIEMRAFKNQKDVYIPLTHVPTLILEKYQYNLPLISEQKFNKYIKEACKEAGIHSEVEIIRRSSGNKEYNASPKVEGCFFTRSN